MELAGWIAAAVVLVVMVVVLARMRSAGAAQIAAERLRTQDAAADAARLPEVRERAQHAEAAVREIADKLATVQGEAAAARARYEDARSAADHATTRLEQLRLQHEELIRQLHTQELLASRATEGGDAARQQAEQLRADLRKTQSELAGLHEQLRTARVELSAMTASRDAAIELANQARAFVEEAKQTLGATFRDAASKVFDEKSAVLDRRIKETGDESRARLEASLKPFSENLDRFRARQEELTQVQVREQASLAGQVKQLQDLNADMAAKTDALTKAMRGNAKTRGDWGEMILETVLKSSGLEEGVNYRAQQSTLDEDTDKRRIPDVVFDLPDGRQVVIDSKVNLVAWADYCNSDDPEEMNDALIRHAAALRAHVKDLAEKNYPKVLGEQTLELTVLFVPIEGAMAAALAFDRNLQADAFSRRIAFASPNTLMAMLKIVERLWMRDKLQKQVGLIGESADKLLDALSAFLNEFDLVGERIDTASKAFRKARSRLSESNQSVIARARRLTDAGVRGKRELHEDLKPAADVDTFLLTQEEP